MDSLSRKSYEEFGTFDSNAEVLRTYRNLPHWFQPGAAVFLTFRTADSMPREVVLQWQRELEDWLSRHGVTASAINDMAHLARLPIPLQREFRRLRDRAWHRALDDCHGKCVLRDPINARVVGDALLHFDRDRYDLDSFIVMPNHVHVLVQFRQGTTLQVQSKSWLRFTAKRINDRYGKRGAFWQTEPFDHLVRSSVQFEYLRRYIAENPEKANLSQGEYLYYRSEGGR